MSIYSEDEYMIKLSIDSILNQTYKGFDFIIVNDNPYNSNINKLLTGYEDSRVIVINNESNIGLTRSLNKALKLVKTKYIARMDADDIAESYRFEKQINILENKDIDICGSNVYVINSNGDITGKHVYPESSSHIKAKMFFRSCICHPSVMFTKKFIDALDGYDDKMVKAQDYELWTRAIINDYEFYNIQECLLKYRMHDNNISTKNIEGQNNASFNIKIKLMNYFTKSDKVKECVLFMDGYNSKINILELFIFYLELLFFVLRKKKNINFLFFFVSFFKRSLFRWYKK
ncbi:glycosyltransferase [Photobacterium damselae]|nr:MULTISPECIES: glycosyltransferase [Gammaproteobacteria]MCG3813612.1 glycosyltransferase [Photobacterium damselae]MCG3880530.1 glycosyltransferase [Psychrobacter sp. Ps6]